MPLDGGIRCVQTNRTVVWFMQDVLCEFCLMAKLVQADGHINALLNR